MNDYTDEPLMDTRLVRPFQATGGRTRPTVDGLDLLTMVASNAHQRPAHLPDQVAEVWLLCRGRQALSIAEIAVHMHLPVGSTKVLVADLIDLQAVQTIAPEPYDDGPSRNVLEALLAGLERRL